jgi:hypothetical protein
MTIETKYNMGDEVWIADIFLEPIKVKVYGIFAEVKDNNVLIDYHVGLDKNGSVLRKEELVFPTKEELLKSL